MQCTVGKHDSRSCTTSSSSSSSSPSCSSSTQMHQLLLLGWQAVLQGLLMGHLTAVLQRLRLKQHQECKPWAATTPLAALLLAAGQQRSSGQPC